MIKIIQYWWYKQVPIHIDQAQYKITKRLPNGRFDKVVSSYEEALDGLEDGMTIIAGGFGLCGIPEGSIAQIKKWALKT